MSDIAGATTYTPNTGLTPAGTQLAQGAPNAANSQAPQGTPQGTQQGFQLPQTQPVQNPNNLSDADLSSAIGTLSGQNALIQNPTFRQGYLNNSNLPAMNQNYDQMAQQLYQLDKNIIAPNYSSPGPSTTPSDAVSFGQGPLGVTASPLALTQSLLGGNNFNFVNPDLAIQSQTAQKSNIADLLDTLNTAIGKEATSREGTYASTVGSIMSALAPLEALQNTRAQTAATLGAANIGANASITNALINLGLIPPGVSTAMGLGGGTGSTGGTGTDINSIIAKLPSGTGAGGATTNADRSAYQQAYNNAPILGPIRKAIEDRWNSTHVGPLFPQADTNNSSFQDFSNKLTSLGAVSSILGTLKGKNSTSGILGPGLLSGVLEHIPGIGPGLIAAGSSGGNTVLNNLNVLQKNGDINAAGDLLSQSPENLTNSLSTTQKNLIQYLENYAQKQGYDDFTQMPQFQQNQALYGNISIRVIAPDGKTTGSVPLTKLNVALQKGYKVE